MIVVVVVAIDMRGGVWVGDGCGDVPVWEVLVRSIMSASASASSLSRSEVSSGSGSGSVSSELGEEEVVGARARKKWPELCVRTRLV